LNCFIIPSIERLAAIMPWLLKVVCCIQGPLAYIPATEMARQAAQIQYFKE